MPAVQPPRRNGSQLPGILLVVGLLAVAAIVLGVLQIARGAGHNLDAMVVTAAPLPLRTAPPKNGPLLLPTIGTAATATPLPPVDSPATVLLLGSDLRPGETAIPRTDAIMVARIDPQAGRVALLSLPRDLWVEIPGHGHNRISNAYLWGERDGPPGAGMSLAAATVEQLLGTAVDHVVLIDLEGFTQLIDVIGGVDVEITQELIDRRYPTNDYGVKTVHFLPGRQRLYGEDALAYARMRHPDSDFDRAQRQQQIVLAIGTRLRERGHLANVMAAEEISAALGKLLITDMPRERMIGLAWALRDLPLSAVEQHAIGADDVSFGVDADLYAQRPQPGVIEAAAQQLLGE
ncbi:MAG: LCP family protein [Oscillochloris sp.]|nr:LCP family protein [Oscillochloris sp.]